MKISIQLISDLKYHILDVDEIRCKCFQCGYIQSVDYTKLILKHNKRGSCQKCTYPLNENMIYEFKPIKINCKWCNPNQLKLCKHRPIKDFIILGDTK